jgi:hypothetical protein
MSAPALRPNAPRSEVILGAVLFLMSAYPRRRCPRIAAAIERHLECLAGRTELDAVLRDLCTGMRAEWLRRANGSAPRGPSDAWLQ